MKTIYLILSVMILFLSGCFKDEGNYDYHDINEVTISGLPEEMQILYKNSDTLRATPVVTGNFDDGDQSRYYYEWKAVSKKQSGNSTTTSYTIGTEQALEYFVTLPDNDYDVFCCVKDTLTRVTWKSSFPIRVTTVLNAGWLVLSDDGQKCRLDLISMSAKETKVIRDVMEDMPELEGPRGLNSVFNMNGASYGTEPRYFLLSQSGAYKLNINEFKWDEANNLRYEMMEFPENYAPGLRAAGYGWELVISEDMAFGVSKPYGIAGPFGLPCNHLTNSEETFKVAEAVGYYPHYYFSNGQKILYDLTNKRFVKLASNMLSCEELKVSTPFFPWTTGKDFVYMGSTPYDGGSTYAILEDGDTHKRYMYMMKVASGITQRKFLPLDDAPEIDKAEHFAVHPSSNWLFYAVGNKVYLYDMNGHSAIPIQLANEKVTLLKFNIFTGLSTDANIQNRLIVGSVDDETTATNGHVRFYAVPSAWGDEFIEPQSYDNFGKPIDVVYTQK